MERTNGLCGDKVVWIVTPSHGGLVNESHSDAPDQAAIVRQYMRYTAQVMSGKNVAKVVMRALQMFDIRVLRHDVR